MYNELPHTGIGAAVLTVVGLTCLAVGAISRFVSKKLVRNGSA